MSTVVDASSLVDYIVSAEGWRLGHDLGERDEDIHVPEVCDLEVVNAVTRLARRRMIDSRRATRALERYVLLPIQRHPHLPLLARVHALSSRFTPYDASYVALAELLGARLLTADGRLAAAARATTGIEVLDTRQ